MVNEISKHPEHPEHPNKVELPKPPKTGKEIVEELLARRRGLKVTQPVGIIKNLAEMHINFYHTCNSTVKP